MNAIEDFKSLLEQIDALLERYDPGELEPDRIVRELFEERAQQRPLLEEAVSLATEGLNRFPFNSELLRRRAWARAHIVTPNGSYPEIALAVEDLRAILAFDPNNLGGTAALLEDMFTFSGMENSEVAGMAGYLAARAGDVLECCLALQIRSHAYADEHAQAKEVYNKAIIHFPDSEQIQEAKKEAESIKSIHEPPNA